MISEVRLDLVLAATAAGVVGLVTSWSCADAWSSRLSSPAVRRWVLVAMAFAAALTGWLYSFPSLVVAGPMLVGVAVTEDRRRRIERRQQQLDEQLPTLVDLMIQRLRSGEGLHGICSRPPLAGTQADELMAPVVAAMADGKPLAVALTHFAETNTLDDGGHRSEEHHLLSTALGVLASRGGPAAPALQRLRLTLGGLAQARADARAQASQAMASGRLLILAPGLFAAMLATFDQEIADLYLRRRVGAACIGVCIALSYCGWRWMNRVVKDADPARRVAATS